MESLKLTEGDWWSFSEGETGAGRGSFHDSSHAIMGTYFPSEEEPLGHRSRVKQISFTIMSEGRASADGPFDKEEWSSVDGSMELSFHKGTFYKDADLKINFDMDLEKFTDLTDELIDPLERFNDLIEYLDYIYEKSNNPKESRTVFIEKNVFRI
jgi:hypothetical protein